MKISDTERVSRADDVVETELDGYTMLMSLEAGRYYSLSPTGTFLWARMAEATPVADLVRAAEAGYEAGPGEAGADVLEFLGDLADRGLIRVG